MQKTGLKGAYLSPQQTRLWSFLGENRAYRAQCTVTFNGRLNTAILQQALRQTLEHYEILHTLFFSPPNMDVPLQITGRQLEVACPIINLEGLHPTKQNIVLNTCFTLSGKEPFEPETGPLIRLILCRLSSEVHLLLVSIHALCADASTLSLFLAALSRRYDSCLQGQVLVERVIQYVAISSWQNKLLSSESAKTAHEFWGKIDLSRMHLQRLPFEQKENQESFSLQTMQSALFEPCTFAVVLEEELSTRIVMLARHYSVSVRALLLTCWQNVLWRLTDEPDWLIGVSCDGRAYEDLADTPGPCTRFVPVDIHCARHQTFEEILSLVNLSLQEAIQWQAYFTWMPEQGSSTDGNNLNFFPVAFEHDIWPVALTSSRLTISLSQRFYCAEPFALKLSSLQIGEHVQLEIHYAPNRMKAEHVHHLAAALHTFLHKVVEYPQAPIGMGSVLSATEQEQLLQAFSAPMNSSEVSTFSSLFESQVSHTPHLPAVLCGNETLTYLQLNRSANRLAHLLRKNGVGPNILVALMLPRSCSILVSMLAILKAGGVFLPLDPDIPLARLDAILSNARPLLLLTDLSLLSLLPQWSSRSLCLDELSADLAALPDTNLLPSPSPFDLAYVIYTSGSTGTPKGVMISQQSLLNYTRAICARLACSPGWQFATVSTLAADLGHSAIFPALISGGCVQLLDYQTVTSPLAFARWAAEHPIDVLKIVPSHLSALLTDELAASFLPRRALLLGGEVLPPALLERLSHLCCQARVYNHYGPTETTIGVLVHLLDSLEVDQRLTTGGTVPLGYPLASCHVAILDPWLQLIPPEVTGELYIGGAGLALGYLGCPDLTAERFVPHPFSSEPGARLYRTGDLARYTFSGHIEFVGRLDNQVKLRGYRIELGEIEVGLLHHPNVRDAVVLLINDGQREAHLGGYVVPRKLPPPTRAELRSFLHERVPDYMIPSELAFLKALPLTANGKVDAQQLRSIKVSEDKRTLSVIDAGEKAKAVVLPRDAVEFQLLQIWEKNLQRAPISIVDNFFDLGGHSILALGLVSHISRQFKQELSLDMLFRHPTIAELAVVLRQKVETGSQSTLVAIQTEGRHSPFFCVHPAGGSVFCYIDLARYLGPEQPFYGLQNPSLDGTGDYLRTVEEMAALYITSIQTVQPQGPYFLGGWSVGGIIAFEMAQQLQKMGHEVALLVIIDSVLSDSQTKIKAASQRDEIEDAQVVKELLGHFGVPLSDEMRQCDAETQLHYVLQEVKKINGIPFDTDIEQVRRIAHTKIMNSRVTHLYEPQGYSRQIDYFVSTAPALYQKFTEAPEDSSEIVEEIDYLKPWQRLASGGMEVHFVPGNHLDLLDEPNVQILARSLMQCIKRICNQQA